MATLKVPSSEAAHVLAAHGNEGSLLLEAANGLEAQPDYKNWKRSRDRWIKRTAAALSHVYEGDTAVKEFSSSAYSMVAARSWMQNLGMDFEHVQDAMNVLVSLSERLQYDQEPGPPVTAAPELSGEAVVFLVHGRDHGTRETVARFLEKTGSHEVVILDEQPDRGQTLLEKLEKHALDAKYAVVLLTGDDVGGAKDESDQQPRGRQNVVFELGWFCGQINRSHVAVLCAPDVERPSDIQGLVYIPLEGDWQRRLVRELTDAGFDYDLGRA